MSICFAAPGRGRSCPLAALTLGAVLVPGVAHAHVGGAPEPHDAWRAWSLEPFVIAGVIAGTWLYLRGVRRVWSRAGRGRGIARWRVRCWIGGMLAIALALLSPIDAVADALFAVHMVQHLLLILVAAPLIVLSEPLLPILWAAPVDTRRTVGRWWQRASTLRALWSLLTRPVVAWTLHVAAVLLWHLPRFYDAAERSGPVHVVEHLCFLATAMLFWWVLVDRRARHRLGTGGAIVYLFAAALESTLLGAAIALAPRPWYTAHWGTTAAWALTPLEDQQVAGLIMWVPGGLVYLVALVPMLTKVLREQTGARGSAARLPGGSRGTRPLPGA